MNRSLVFSIVVLGLGCGTQPITDVDSGVIQEQDSGVFVDAGAVDAGQLEDAGVALDAGNSDAGSAADAGVVDAGVSDAGPGVDLDGDGLDDALEARLAQDYLPVLGIHPQD